MDAWIDAITPLTGIEPTGTELSLSQLRLLLPEGRFFCLRAAVIAFCLIAAWQDARFRRQRKPKSDSASKPGAA